MPIGSLNELQSWIRGRQKRKTVGIFNERDIKTFWETQKIFENAVSINRDVGAFLYMKPMATWSEYSNNTNYKGPCQTLSWWSSGDYKCEREEAEHKYYDKLDDADITSEFYGILTAKEELLPALLRSTINCWVLGAKFKPSFHNTPNTAKEIMVIFERTSDLE